MPDSGIVIRVIKVTLDDSELDPSQYKMTSTSTLTFEEDSVPTADSTDGIEVEDKGGILVNRATEINLEKIEELFLHTINQEHKIKKLESENQVLSQELKAMQNDLEEIKALLEHK